MHKKFEINQTKIKGGCQQGRKVVTHNSRGLANQVPLQNVPTKFQVQNYLRVKIGLVLNVPKPKSFKSVYTALREFSPASGIPAAMQQYIFRECFHSFHFWMQIVKFMELDVEQSLLIGYTSITQDATLKLSRCNHEKKQVL